MERQEREPLFPVDFASLLRLSPRFGADCDQGAGHQGLPDDLCLRLEQLLHVVKLQFLVIFQLRDKLKMLRLEDLVTEFDPSVNVVLDKELGLIVEFGLEFFQVLRVLWVFGLVGELLQLCMFLLEP